MPSQITSNRGVQFTSTVWQDWGSQHAVRQVTTTAFHPQPKGMVERLHRQMKEVLHARRGGSLGLDHLPCMMLGIRATPKDACGVSAGQAALGHLLSVPGQLLPPPSTRFEDQLANRGGLPQSWQSYAQVAGILSPLDKASWVYMQHGGSKLPLGDSYRCPFLVLERGSKCFNLQVGPRVEMVSMDRLKVNRGTLDPDAEQLPLCGRPPVIGHSWCCSVLCFCLW